MNAICSVRDQVPSLPFISADLRGIGGKIKAEPGDFEVVETPSYEPLGTGTGPRAGPVHPPSLEDDPRIAETGGLRHWAGLPPPIVDHGWARDRALAAYGRAREHNR